MYSILLRNIANHYIQILQNHKLSYITQLTYINLFIEKAKVNATIYPSKTLLLLYK